jgi:hypothetical protein
LPSPEERNPLFQPARAGGRAAVVWCCGGAGREGAKEKMASASKRTEGEKLAWVGGGDLKKKGGGDDGRGRRGPAVPNGRTGIGIVISGGRGRRGRRRRAGG